VNCVALTRYFQDMRVIINDKRYSALKTLGEKKQAFNEVCLCFSSNANSFFDTLLQVSVVNGSPRFRSDNFISAVLEPAEKD
jgi:hypothetical protein